MYFFFLFTKVESVARCCPGLWSVGAGGVLQPPKGHGEKRDQREQRVVLSSNYSLRDLTEVSSFIFPHPSIFFPPMSLQRLSHFQVSESESVEMLHFKTCITWAQMWLWTLKNGIKLWWTNSWINTKIGGASWQHPAAETPLLLTHTQKRREWVRGNAETLWQEWEAHPCPH